MPESSSSSTVTDQAEHRNFAATMLSTAVLSAIASSISSKPKEVIWLVDSGASFHVTGDRSILYNYYDEPEEVYQSDGSKLFLTGFGEVIVTDVETKQIVTLRNVGFIPTLTVNLFSTAVIMNLDYGRIVTENHSAKIYLHGVKVLVGRPGPSHLNVVVIRTIVERRSSNPVVASVTGNQLELWHERLLHVNYRTRKKMARLQVVADLPTSLESPELLSCHPCVRGQMTEVRHSPVEKKRKFVAGEYLHCDVAGWFCVSLAQHQYFVVFKDDESSYRKASFMRNRNEFPDVLRNLILDV